ncbi:MAG: prolipoprotein diacylglyceryl transferase [Wenzhouxiangellaceae bacterium]|nr:prolipoprotein diacylglyceryl transferase [Wenzhouxiangellaceae bacterium]
MSGRPLLVDIDPVALDLGFWQIHWYGITYLVAFASCWWLLKRRAQAPHWPLAPVQVGDLIFWGVIGVIVGGRLGYVLFYGLEFWFADPLYPLWIHDGGMSFHGGLAGVLVTLWLYARHHGIGFLKLGDFVAQVGPLGLACGRIGNFIGGELWGRVSEHPWAMIFPNSLRAEDLAGQTLEQAWRSGALDGLARHPSQLYQAALEGLLLFVLVWWFARRPRPTGAVGGLFLAGYAVFRSLAEFFREPDAHLGFVAFDWLTMGQLLSLPMFIAGIALMLWAYRRPA